MISETKCTCAGCGNVFFYGKTDERDQLSAARQNRGDVKACCYCAGCTSLPFRPVVDLGRCPKCGSRALKKEIVTHDL